MNINAKYRALMGRSATRILFILGTGRSGTHWLAHTLESHPELQVLIEKPPIFQWSTEMALNPAQESTLLPKLVRRYRWEYIKAAPRHLVDKSHPNIWIAEKLADAFPHALFIGIEREVYGTVASMLKHDDVLAWQRRWREFPLPNRFLGIDGPYLTEYPSLPEPARCALRWLAHKRRMDGLRKILGSKMLVVNYEALMEDTPWVLAGLEKFMGLRAPLPHPPIHYESRDKWQTQLSPDDIRQIDQIVGAHL